MFSGKRSLAAEALGKLDRATSPPRGNFAQFRRCAYTSMSRSEAGRFELRGFQAVMSRSTYAAYTVSPRHWCSEVRLAILGPCRQVCFPFLGLLTGRWHTLCCSGALAHECAKCRLAKLVNLCIVIRLAEVFGCGAVGLL